LETTAKNARKWKRRDASDFQAVSQWFAGMERQDVRRLLDLLTQLADSLPAANERGAG